MSLLLLVLTPLAGAALLAVLPRTLIPRGHAVITLLTLGTGGHVVLEVARTGNIVSLGGHLRAGVMYATIRLLAFSQAVSAYAVTEFHVRRKQSSLRLCRKKRSRLRQLAFGRF